MVPDEKITQILQRISAGRSDELPRLLDLVYEELRGLARGLMQHERPNHTLQPTAVVHEAFIRLSKQRRLAWLDRTHFFAAAAVLIRRILVDHARGKNRAKRGAGYRQLTIAGLPLNPDAASVDLVSLHEALQRLAEIDAQQAQIVELRFFGGLTIEEVAEVLQVGKRTVDRDWRCAKTWLLHELTEV